MIFNRFQGIQTDLRDPWDLKRNDTTLRVLKIAGDLKRLTRFPGISEQEMSGVLYKIRKDPPISILIP